MALLGDFGENYTRTGNGFLTRVANVASFMPWPLSILSAPITFIAGFLDTGLESLGWLFRGKFMSAATVAAAGTVGTVVNTGQSIIGGPFWWNIGSGLTTGRSIGTHARALTEGAIGTVGGALGMRPTVLRSYTAGIGSVNNGRSGPGYWATRAAEERGQDPRARYAAYRNGDGRDHVAALEAAAAQQRNYRGM